MHRIAATQKRAGMANRDQQRLRIVDRDASAHARHDEADRHGEPGRYDQPGMDAGRVYGVGAVLRAERRRLGLELDEVAQKLRIRRAHLEAIEAERFENLPGATYAVGFVRAYSDFLDLDTDEVVRRFRDQARDVQRPANLVFRQPMPEARFPTGAVLLIAVLLAAVAYGGWYYLSMTNRSPMSLVDGLPDRLVALLPGQESADPGGRETGGPGSADPAQVPENGGSTAAPPMQMAAPGLETPPAVVIPPPDAPALPPVGTGADGRAESAAEAFSADTMIDTGPPGPESPGEGPAAPGGAGPGAAGGSGEAAEADQVPPLPEPAPPVASLAPPPGQPATPPPPPAVGAGDSSRVYGQPGGSTRVQIRATGDSWLQVLESNGSVLLSRTLRPGDTYHVPDREGLTLWTGNAGALELFVDGERIPPLGEFGAVRRDVDLTPDALRARP